MKKCDLFSIKSQIVFNKLRFKILDSQFKTFLNVIIIIFKKKIIYIFKISKNLKKFNKIINFIKTEFHYLIILKKKKIYILNF